MVHPKHKKIAGRYHLAVVHRNNRNIFSIIFEELNLTDEKFRNIKKGMIHGHSNRFNAVPGHCEEVFSRQS